ncbi:MAG: DEAD/DEAH box helicase [Bdellovibrionales bacterium]|nr:DEAD/DEAH box helicase [Bdellovibrionales bacterium]
MAKLIEHCRGAFASVIRSRGQDYFESGRVSPIRTPPGRPTAAGLGKVAFAAVVKGSESNYQVQVELDASAREMYVECECPYFNGGAFCKHIWAVLLKADREFISDIALPLGADLSVLHKWDHADETAKHLPRNYSPTQEWRMHLMRLKFAYSPQRSLRSSARKASAAPYYVLQVGDRKFGGGVGIEFREMTEGKSKLKRAHYSAEDALAMSDPLDREMLSMLLLLAESNSRGYPSRAIDGCRIDTDERAGAILWRLLETRRLIAFPEFETAEPVVLTKDPDETPWGLRFRIKAHSDQNFELQSLLVRHLVSGQRQELSLHEPWFILESGVIASRAGVLSRLEQTSDFSWIGMSRDRDFPMVPKADLPDFLNELRQTPSCPRLEFDDACGWRHETPVPIPTLALNAPEAASVRRIPFQVYFEYPSERVLPGASRAAGDLFLSLNASACVVELRNSQFEEAAIRGLIELSGVSVDARGAGAVARESFSDVVSDVLQRGWQVEASGKPFSLASDFNISLTSGVDWFDLNGDIQFANEAVGLPAILAAKESGSLVLKLKNGGYGLLPEAWLQKYAPMLRLGKRSAAGISFGRAQGALLAAWMGGAGDGGSHEIKVDKSFTQLKKSLETLTVLKPLTPSKGALRGTLRSYQKRGLSWLTALSDLKMGGVLADDMGLGKTIQVLSLLSTRSLSASESKRRPSLVIVPKSLVFNWQDEAARFTPKLRTAVYAGSGRSAVLNKVSDYDLIFVTYSILRLDIDRFAKQTFDYVIVDEAQAIKNRSSLVHRACCQIKAEHRLALTGTPVENSVEDLLSLFHFVSPGLISSSLRDRLVRAGSLDSIDREVLNGMGRALQPFILRRKKSDVLKDLPQKSESIIHCELSGEEMRRYKELRDFYRRSLAGKIEQEGLAKSKIVVLEALLRLRQAACHPGLIDHRMTAQSSSKIDVLLEHLTSIRAEGHRTLVFSQFTSLLDIAGRALTEKGISFERLDGTTNLKERKIRVERFQKPTSETSVFLISLKAGGVGLNLTAADYVFLLDPWWNPAAESQAIDRAHRIGQTKKVMAYRLIAKGTVEEKIVELQKTKRDIADAIVGADSGLLKNLSLKDIQMLLS